jgi:hypothetical protein
MNNDMEIKWLDEPEDHNYPAAQSFLSLIFDQNTAEEYVLRLKKAPLVEFKAKDILRASGLSPLGLSNVHIVKDRKKIDMGRALSPLLLVRDKVNVKVIIADGYHRMCSVYMINEDAVIPCKII